MKVGLFGTCNGSAWREELKPMLKIDFFDPVVPDWTEACYKEELKQREECDYCLYVITPLISGFYSIAEVVDDSNKRPDKTIFCVLQDAHAEIGACGQSAFNHHQIKSLEAVAKMVKANGGKYFDNLTDVSNFLNYQGKTEYNPRKANLTMALSLPANERLDYLKKLDSVEYETSFSEYNK